MAKRQNYLNNRDMLKQIHISKSNFSWFEDRDRYHQFDIILGDANEITPLEEILKPENIEQAKLNQAARRQKVAYDACTDKKMRQVDFAVDINSIRDEDVVFRVVTFEHIPDEPGRKKNPKTIADTKAKLNFVPFKQYVIRNGQPACVGISHFNKDKEFDIISGNVTATLANMYIKLVERYSQKGNWRGYTYNDEMKGQALLQLAQVGLQFNEAKSDNPFAYYTATVNNSFTRVLNAEKKNQGLRDDLLQQAGQTPSWTRQIEHEMKSKERWEKVMKSNLNDETNVPIETIKEIYADDE